MVEIVPPPLLVPESQTSPALQTNYRKKRLRTPGDTGCVDLLLFITTHCHTIGSLRYASNPRFLADGSSILLLIWQPMSVMHIVTSP